MDLLNAILYDPATVATHSTTALLAMTAFDTTNLRLNVVVPSHGFVRFRIVFQITGATTFPQVHAGVMNGSTVVARVTPTCTVCGTAVATTRLLCVADFVVPGLTPGSTNFDAAYGVDLVLASTSIKYGGPDNTTATDAYGAFVFEAWDPKPNPTNFGLFSIDGNGRVDVIKIAGTTQTARDIGASVLLSSGTGTGQLDFTSGVVKANVTQYGGSNGTFASGRPEVNASHFGGTAGTFSSGRPEVNTTHWKGTAAGTVDTAGYPVVTIKDGVAAGELSLSAGKVKVATIANNAITSYTLAADSIGASQLAADAVTEIQSGLATAASISALNNVSAATVRTQVDDALVAIHLDHLLATDYDPASKPGTSTALLNELIGSDAGVSQFTANALELGPTGSGLDAAGVRAAVGLTSANLDTQLGDIPTNAELATALGAADDATLAAIAGISNAAIMQSTTIATLASQIEFTLTAGSADDKAYEGCMVVVTDASTSTQKATAPVLSYIGSTKTIRLAFDPGVFTMAAGDSIAVIAANERPVVHVEMSVKSTAGTTAQLAVWMEVAGKIVPVASIDASASCSVVVREHDAGVNLFTAAGAAADITNSVFQYEQASPGFTDDRQYIVTATVTLNGVAFSSTHNRVVIG